MAIRANVLDWSFGGFPQRPNGSGVRVHELLGVTEGSFPGQFQDDVATDRIGAPEITEHRVGCGVAHRRILAARRVTCLRTGGRPCVQRPGG